MAPSAFGSRTWSRLALPKSLMQRWQHRMAVNGSGWLHGGRGSQMRRRAGLSCGKCPQRVHVEWEMEARWKRLRFATLVDSGRLVAGQSYGQSRMHGVMALYWHRLAILGACELPHEYFLWQRWRYSRESDVMEGSWK